MAAATQTQAAVVQKAVATVVPPMTLGFTDCVALLLGFLLMLMSALVPTSTSDE